MTDEQPKVFLTDEQWEVLSDRDKKSREQLERLYLIQSDALISTSAHVAAQTEIQQNAPTMRDQFAMSALTGLIAQSNGTAMSSEFSMGAEWAYRMADAMMAARSAK